MFSGERSGQQLSRYGSLAMFRERGVLLKEGQTLKSLYEERVPLYEKYADIVELCILDVFCRATL